MRSRRAVFAKDYIEEAENVLCAIAVGRNLDACPHKRGWHLIYMMQSALA